MLSMQHNIVNILRGIKGAMEVHFESLDPELPAGQESVSKNADFIMRRTYDQISQVLALTQKLSLALKAVSLPEPAAGVSIKEVWQEAVEILGRHYPVGKIEVIAYIPKEYPLILCDRNDLLEIFYTIAQNSVQAMEKMILPGKPPVGKLIIRANLQLIPGSNPSAVITLSDTGPGIEEGVLGRIFDPFFTTKNPENGNGLGLCLVRSLVKRNGGSVTASSFKGYGTTFTLGFKTSRAQDEKENNITMAGSVL